MKVKVTFLKHYKYHNPGDTAVVSVKRAIKLASQGIVMGNKQLTTRDYTTLNGNS